MVRQVSHFLLVFDRSHSRLLREQAFTDHRQALVERFRAERLHRENIDIEVVVLSADSKDALRRTHARYFQTVSALATTASSRTAAARARKTARQQFQA